MPSQPTIADPSPSRTAAVVIVAGGRGERAGADGGPKQYRTLAGKAVIAHALEAFLAEEAIARAVIVIHPDDGERLATSVDLSDRRVAVVHGGSTRQRSTLAGLDALALSPPDIVLIHDAARPFVDRALVARTLAAVGQDAAALPAVAVSDTLKRGGTDGLVSGTVPRDGLFAAQTPQGFPFAAIHAAHRRAAAAGRDDFTDDAAIAEWAGLSVRLVEGSPENTKITWARDIALAEARLRPALQLPDVRVGNGYDVHAFGAGDHVTLCGIIIPHGRALVGHSDADVGLHALTDALLATCGAGDIGTHFPPSEARWRGAASRVFVEHAVRIVRDRGGRIANADITLICEAPRIGPHREAMTAALAGMLGIAPGRVSVKATTNERLGFVGREEGIAAIATASVVFPGGLDP